MSAVLEGLFRYTALSGHALRCRFPVLVSDHLVAGQARVNNRWSCAAGETLLSNYL